MEMMHLSDLIGRYLFLSSALLLIMGIMSLLILLTLKINGKPRLWICILLFIIPLAYPIRTLIPRPVVVSEIQGIIRFPDFQPVKTILLQKPGIRDISVTSEGASLNEIHTSEKTETGHNNSSVNANKNAIKVIFKPGIDWKLIGTVIWGLIFLCLLTRLLYMFHNMNRLPGLANTVTNPDVINLFHRCIIDTGLRHTPRLLTMDGIPAPMVMGIIKPGIIIPGRLLQPGYREGLRFTFLHELKHVRQRHNWWLLIESIIGAAFFFHPVIHWAKGRIHEEMEHICDRHVIHVTEKSVSYAYFLLQEIWNTKNQRVPALALPFISGVNKTKRRIHKILENARPTLFAQIRGRIALGLILISFVSLLLCSASPSAHLPQQTIFERAQPAAFNHGNISLPAKPDTMEKRLNTPETEKIIILEKSVENPKEPSSQNDTIEISQSAKSGNKQDRSKEDIGVVLMEMPADTSISKDNSPSIVMVNAGIQKENDVANQPELNPLRQADKPELDFVMSKVVLSDQKEPDISIPLNESGLAETKSEKYLGTPVNMLNFYKIDDIKILDDRTILFIMKGKDLYMSRLSDPCPGLLVAEDFKFNPIAGNITKFDYIQAFSHNRIVASAGILGDFYPYLYEGKRIKAIRLLENGLLNDLIAKGAFGRHS